MADTHPNTRLETFCDGQDKKSTVVMRANRRNGYLALIAFRFPLAIAIGTTMFWAYWLVLGFRMGS